MSRYLIPGSPNDSFLAPVACQSGSAAAAALKTDQEATQGGQETGIPRERNPSPHLHPRPSLCLCWLTPLLPSCPLPHASHAVPTVPNVVIQPSAAGPTVLSPFSMLIMCILSHILNLCYHQYTVSSSLVFLSFFLWTPTDFTKVFQDSWYTQLLQRLLSFFDLFNYFYKCFKSMTYAANLRLCILNNIFYHCLSFE